MKRVLIGGGSGFIGSALSNALRTKGYGVTIISRSTRQGETTWEEIERKGLPEADAVLNLAGSNILKFVPWTQSYRTECIDSRIKTTKLLSEAILSSKKPPSVFVCTSAVGYYPPHPTKTYTEKDVIDTRSSSDFAGELCGLIENTVKGKQLKDVRVVAMRTGIVMGAGGGAWENMRLPFLLGLGGPFGDGHQPFPWVHLSDVVGLYIHAIENSTIEGPLNAVAPDAVTNLEFVKTLGYVMKRPTFLPVPAFSLNALLGKERARMLLEGQFVVPEKALETGYTFKYPTAKSACQQLAS